MTTKITDCYKCKHFEEYHTIKTSCSAFPKGIPNEILREGKKHNKPLPNQKNNIIFEEI